MSYMRWDATSVNLEITSLPLTFSFLIFAQVFVIKQSSENII